MAIVLQKFGGRLLETPEKIHRAADFIIAAKSRGDDPVVVVSAPGRMTDQFLALAHEITPHPDERELDMLLSVGERTAMALLAMAINAAGNFHAVSFTGSQVGIITDTHHTDARIIEIKGYRIKEALGRGEIPIIAGFQGVSTNREITTLGRGGSDASAVALAAALGAVRCELVKEYGAIYTADPEQIEGALPVTEINYQTLESLTAAGAKVVQPRAASLAREHQVVLEIKGPDGKPGTLVTDRSLDAGPVAALTENDKIIFRLGPPPANETGQIRIESHLGNHYAAAIERAELADGDMAAALITAVGWGGNLPRGCGKRIGEIADGAGVKLLMTALLGERYGLVVARDKAHLLTQAIHDDFVSSGWIRPPEAGPR